MSRTGTAARTAAVVCALGLLGTACGRDAKPTSASTSTSSSTAEPVASTDGVTTTTAPTTAPPVVTTATTAVATTARPATTAAPTTTTKATAKAPTTTAAPDPARAKLALSKVAGLESPDAMAVRPGDPAVYVAERVGRVRRILGGQVQADPVVDLTAETDTTGERGLIGMAFAPATGKLYLDITGHDGTIHILEFRLQDGKAVDRRELLSIDHHQFSNHNGGGLVFGPDGMLYIGVGDGGSGGDPNHHGQDLGTLLAKILRIDPTPTAASPYTVPADNPFVGRSGARPEVWAYGLRNPWRFSFDRSTGDLWIGDVGQDTYEEIDLARAGSKGGENYGWSLREGTHPYNGGARPAGSVDPVYDYAHSTGGCSVTGGYVYRGSAIPKLAGSYLFGDYCAGTVHALTMVNGRATVTDLDLDVDQLDSFGQDQAGELYTLSLDGSVSKIVPA